MMSKRARERISEPIVCGLLRLFDLAAIVFGSLTAYAIWLHDSPYADWADYLVISLFGALLAVNLFHLNECYRFDTREDLGGSIQRTTLAWIEVACLLIAASFLTKASDDFSRVWAVLWFAIALLALCTIRIAISDRLQTWTKAGKLYRKVVIVGKGAVADRLLQHLSENPKSGVRVLGVFDDRHLKRDGAGPDDCFVCGDLDALIDFVRRDDIDSIIVALPWSDEDRLLDIFIKLSELPVDIRLCADLVGFHLMERPVSYIDRLMMLNVLDKPFTDWRLVAKEIEDRLVAALVLILIGPLMLAIAAAIRIDSPGPVLFRQKRYGFNNRLIEVLKFRTMYYEDRDDNAEQLTRRDDPRVTPVGRFLRRTSLDELPQFINVLRGEMSVVGPRPHALSAKADGLLYEKAVRKYFARHRVKPGITGWAQINGWRGETETVEQIRKRVEHDLVYIENWSLWLDLKIILRTTFSGFTGDQAY